MKEITDLQLAAIRNRFDYEGELISVTQPAGGHINNTYCLHYSENSYILQRINTEVFQKPGELTENILKVTSHLRNKILKEDGCPERGTLTPVFTKDGAAFTLGEDGSCWRSFLYIDNTVCYTEKVQPALFQKCGKAFGRFQNMLADLPADGLYETIQGFHNTRERMLQFESACDCDLYGRAGSAEAEIQFLRARRKYSDLYSVITSEKEIPLRIVHNDAKLSNILFDAASGEPVCIIDLDTIMPGLLIYDFGDAIRFGACSSAEDEPDTDKVHFLPEEYEAYLSGFLEGCAQEITDREIELLPYGAMMITYEQALRFLTDYLKGDVYYHTDRPGQNLDRARVQIRLLDEMEHYFKTERISK